jgi:hypothetical protein
MEPKDLRASTARHVGDYINNRIAGSNKQESAQLAGYSGSTSRNPTLIESTQAYAVIINEVLTVNSNTLRTVMHEMTKESQNDEIDWKKMYLMSQVAEKMTNIHDTLTPRVTVKTTTDAKGNKTSTAWGSNSSILHDALGS